MDSTGSLLSPPAGAHGRSQSPRPQFTWEDLARLYEANKISLGTMGSPCLPDTNHSAGGA